MLFSEGGKVNPYLWEYLEPRDRDLIERAVQVAKERGCDGFKFECFNQRDYDSYKAYALQLWPEAKVFSGRVEISRQNEFIMWEQIVQ